MGPWNSKQSYAGRIRAAAGEGVQHAQQDLAQGLVLCAGFIEVTYDAAHMVSVILVVYYKYY